MNKYTIKKAAAELTLWRRLRGAAPGERLELTLRQLSFTQDSELHTVRKVIRGQGSGSFVRNSYVSTLYPVVICPI